MLRRPWLSLVFPSCRALCDAGKSEASMKLLPHHKEMIAYLYTKGWCSPLEIADELGLTFRQVCGYIDRACLRNIIIHVARDVEKATRAGCYPAVDCGFYNPFGRQ